MLTKFWVVFIVNKNEIIIFLHNYNSKYTSFYYISCTVIAGTFMRECKNVRNFEFLYASLEIKFLLRSSVCKSSYKTED